MNTEKIKYYLYTRKSSESDDRQIQSIGDQTDSLIKLAEQDKIEVVEILSEAKSAKNPNNRPVFDKMLQNIEDGKANGILCWEINRLSRNPIDSGRIQWMLQQGIIKSIRTINREYRPDDNALILSVESGSANDFILNLKRGVKRGIDSKLVKGHAPILAPLGYLNTKIEARGDNYIIKDPERFDLIRKAWDMMLSGSYNPPQILEIMTNDWGIRTRKTKRKGNKPLSRSTIYRIFSDVFYAGFFEYRGITHQGKHESMITLEEFDKVQILLGREGRPRPKTHEFPFTGIIKCGECGSFITAIEKTKIIKSTGELKTFRYYYCSRKKNNCKCYQNKYLNGEELENQIDGVLKDLTILPEFKDWALEILRESNDKEIMDRGMIYETQHKTLTETQNQLDNLTKMRYRELINDEEYMREKNILQSQISEIKENLRNTENRAEKWIDLTEKTFEFACYARSNFNSGDKQTKREILTALGQNYTLKDKKLVISLNEWLKPIVSQYPAIEKEYNRQEPKKGVAITRQKELLSSLSPIMRDRPDSNR